MTWKVKYKGVVKFFDGGEGESWTVEDPKGNLLGCMFDKDFICYTYNSEKEALEAILNNIGQEVVYESI